VKQVLGDILPIDFLKEIAGKDSLNMTMLALNLSKYINGVAKKHGEVSQHMFPGYHIHAITNGVHSFTWTCEDMAKLYDAYIPGWRERAGALCGAAATSLSWSSGKRTGRPSGSCWRMCCRKRRRPGPERPHARVREARDGRTSAASDLSDMDRLLQIARKRKIQIIYAGKAHPYDDAGKRLIQGIYGYRDKLREILPVVFLPDYKMDIALKLVSGVDVWLNTPLRPLEASGTSA